MSKEDDHLLGCQGSLHDPRCQEDGGRDYKVKPHNLRLFKDREELKDDRTVAEYGFTANSAKPQQPGSIGLAFRNDNGDWEDLEISPLSQPPELPEVMRPQETSQSEQAPA